MLIVVCYDEHTCFDAGSNYLIILLCISLIECFEITHEQLQILG